MLTPCTESRQQTSSPSLEAQDPRAKEALKEKKVLEKKMALSRKRKWDSRCVYVCNCVDLWMLEFELLDT